MMSSMLSQATRLLALLIIKECFSQAMEHVDLEQPVNSITPAKAAAHLYQSQPASRQDSISNTGKQPCSLFTASGYTHVLSIYL